MKTIKNMKWIAIVTVLAATLTGPFAAAQDKKKPVVVKKKHATGKPKETVQQQLRRYAHSYNLNDDDRAKIEKILTAQQKDIADFEKVHGPQIKKLQDEISKLVQAMDVHLKARRELELDHQAELDKAITAEQKATRMVAYLKGYNSDAYWKFLPKEVQAALNQQCQAAAMELISGGADQARTGLKDASRKLHASIDKILTPELRQAAETRYLQEHMIRSYAHHELTDDQKTRIRELCAKNVKDKIATSERYRQLTRDIGAMKPSLSKYKGSYHTHKIRTEVAEKILTEEQRKKAPAKHKTAAKKDRKDKPSTKKSAKKATPSP